MDSLSLFAVCRSLVQCMLSVVIVKLHVRDKKTNTKDKRTCLFVCLSVRWSLTLRMQRVLLLYAGTWIHSVERDLCP